jgi:epoxyqueuosine reductase
MQSRTDIDLSALTARIRTWGAELGFAKLGIAGIELDQDEAHLLNWLHEGRHGAMEYMQRHGVKRSRPHELQPGTVRVISARMNYFPEGSRGAWQTLRDPERGYIARYALGRDYHKLMRARLQKLADRIEAEIGPFGYRAFADSAPVLEKALARNAGLGWIGKHTLLLDRDAGSWFFLGELYTDLPLPTDAPSTEHCGTCTRCIDICPTQAITGPRQLDARRCIAYLTIELKEAIPEELRPLIGNRVFGCDDCQLVCPWNKFAQPTREEDFAPRHGLDGAKLVELFAWSEEEFLAKTEGMPIRRAGYQGWLRNVAVALGNAPHSDGIVEALRLRAEHPSALVREHVAWALAEQSRKRIAQRPDPRPQPPEKPLPGDCCDSGCDHCVLDVYAQQMEVYRERLAAWRQRHPDASADAHP